MSGLNQNHNHHNNNNSNNNHNPNHHKRSLPVSDFQNKMHPAFIQFVRDETNAKFEKVYHLVQSSPALYDAQKTNIHNFYYLVGEIRGALEMCRKNQLSFLPNFLPCAHPAGVGASASKLVVVPKEPALHSFVNAMVELDRYLLEIKLHHFNLSFNHPGGPPTQSAAFPISNPNHDPVWNYSPGNNANANSSNSGGQGAPYPLEGQLRETPSIPVNGQPGQGQGQGHGHPHGQSHSHGHGHSHGHSPGHGQSPGQSQSQGQSPGHGHGHGQSPGQGQGQGQHQAGSSTGPPLHPRTPTTMVNKPRMRTSNSSQRCWNRDPNPP